MKRYLFVLAFVFIASLWAFPAFCRDITFIDNNNVIYVFSGNRYFTSKDEGINWEKLTLPTSKEAEPLEVFSIDGKLLLLLQEKDKIQILKSSDNNTWDKLDSLILSPSPDVIEIKNSDNDFYIVFSDRSNLYLTKFSYENGYLSFSPVLSLDYLSGIQDFSIEIKGNYLKIFHRKIGEPAKVYCLNIKKDNLNPAETLTVLDTENIEQFFTEKDWNDEIRILYLKNDLSGQSIYSKTETGEAASKPIYSFKAKPLNLKIERNIHGNPFLEFQYEEKIYLLNLLPKWEKSIDIPSESEKKFFKFVFTENELFTLFIKEDEIIAEEIKNMPPKSNYTFEETIYHNSKYLTIEGEIKDIETESVVLKTSLEKDSQKEIAYISINEAIGPINDGIYKLGIIPFDGISYGETKEFTLHIDTKTSTIEIVSPTSYIVSSSPVIIKGIANKSGLEIEINSYPASFESDNIFSAEIPLQNGKNIIEIKVSDKTGNLKILNREIFYDPNIVHIEFDKPTRNDWYKKDASILLVANVINLKENVGAINAFVDSQRVNSLLNLQENNSVMGFVPLDSEMSDGEHSLKIEIQLQDEIVTGETKFMIDTTPPVFSKQENDIECDETKIPLPIQDNESGINIETTSIKLTSGDNKIEGEIRIVDGQYYFCPETKLTSGIYIIEIAPQDSAGNIAEAREFKATVKSFSALAIQSVDSITIENGPNPFNPSRGEDHKIICRSPDGFSKIELFIFDLLGNILFHEKQTGTIVSQIDFSWDGKDSLGKILPSGLYLYAVIYTDTSGESDISRGKIILF